MKPKRVKKRSIRLTKAQKIDKYIKQAINAKK